MTDLRDTAVMRIMAPSCENMECTQGKSLRNLEDKRFSHSANLEI